jgi:hypothetical protein
MVQRFIFFKAGPKPRINMKVPLSKAVRIQSLEICPKWQGACLHVGSWNNVGSNLFFLNFNI